MAPVASKVKAIAVAAGVAALGAALDSLTTADLGFLGSWQTVGALALATAIGWLKTETVLARYFARPK